ncbi:transposase [Streptomyces sp. NPDC102365]|uniref:transposase n=1 Tax=Streptomyces sp. NPDC102365 TaxID=3366162 RepID=UPI00381F153B
MTDVTSDNVAGEAAVGATSTVDDGPVAELVARAQAGGVKLTGEGGLLQQLTKRVLESAPEGELTDHLGHEPGERAAGDRENYRNGHRSKTVITESGPVGIVVPRDRAGPFEPQLVGTVPPCRDHPNCATSVEFDMASRCRHAHSTRKGGQDMKHTGYATLDVPAGRVDLEDWLFTLSDAEYQACARGHRAAGTFVQDGVRGTVNVEAIGGHLIVQHYQEVSAKPSRVEMLSRRSRVYLFHLVPATIQVRWTMSVNVRNAESSEFRCSVELTMSPLLRALGALSLLGVAIRAHTLEETKLFGDDIVRKIGTSRPSPAGA